MARNGCVENHYAVITDRGGKDRVSVLTDLTEVRWERTVDDIATAVVEVSGDACRDQADRLGLIEARRHELVIYRGEDRVWEGPIVAVKWGLDSVTIQAHDVLEYLDGRAITEYWPGPENGGPELMGDRIEEIIRFELSNAYLLPGYTIHDVDGWIPSWDISDTNTWTVNPPIHVLEHLEVSPGEVLTRTETLPFEMTVYEHLSNLAEGGLDYTTIGRKILIWDSREEIGRTRTLTSKDFSGDVEIASRGQDLVSVQHVIASPNTDEEENPATSTDNVGSAYREDFSTLESFYYGPWTKIHTRGEDDGNEPSQEALRTQALALSVRGIPLPTEIEVGGSSSLRLDHTLTINHLIAGTTVPVLAEMAGRTLNQLQRFTRIQVTETANGENISVSLEPFGEVSG